MAVPTPPPQASPFAAVLDAVLARLASALGVSRAYVRPVAKADYRVAELEPVQAYVQPFGIGSPRDKALSFENHGAGNLTRPVERRLRVYLHTRSGEDVVAGDDVALLGALPAQAAVGGVTPTAPGQFLWEEVIMAALSDWMPVGTVNGMPGVPLTIGPIHPLDSSGGPPVRDDDVDGMIQSVLDFGVVYGLAIRPNEPNW